MSIKKDTKYGGIDISTSAIATVAGDAAAECYGVVGLAKRGSIVDSALTLLKKEEYAKGVYPHKTKEGYDVDIYVYCAFGIKLTEIVLEIQKKVRYVLEKTFGIKFRDVNVYVVDIKEINHENA